MFEGWDTFFEISGEAAATLTGLIFVVVTLMERSNRTRMLRAVSIYLTPTVLHFAIVFTISALAEAPRLPLALKAAIVGVGALIGLGNGSWACHGMINRTLGATSHWSDLWLYGAAPTALYAGVLAAAVALAARMEWAVHALAALLIALLLLGIRNGWDLITWIAPSRGQDAGSQDPGGA